MKELTHFIDGKHANGTSGRFCDGFEPMTGEAISRVPLASKTEVRVAVENAIGATGLGRYKSTAPCPVLMKFLELVQDHHRR
jgi:malonate-semialdehyde dehydrogenase (acetylating) / methylmalonate-semialdehyde dehydrogenase